MCLQHRKKKKEEKSVPCKFPPSSMDYLCSKTQDTKIFLSKTTQIGTNITAFSQANLLYFLFKSIRTALESDSSRISQY